MANEIKKNNNVIPNENTGSVPSKNYFSLLADKYSKASHILYIALLVCFVFTLVFNSKILTYNNFSYLFKDLNAAAEIASGNYNSISYANDKLRTTKAFRGGIVTASTTDMAIYNATGKKSLHINENFVLPEIAVSQKYAIIYDQGGNNYSIYNSFARVHNAKTPHSISNVTVADNGWYAIVSKDNEHTTAVYLYDDDFNLRNSYLFATKYVFSISINATGNRIAIICAEASPNGDGYLTSVIICDPGKDSSRAEISLGKGIPFGSSFTDNEMLNVVCSDALYVLSENNGEIKNKYEFEKKNANKMSVGSAGCAIAFSDNKGKVSTTLLVFNANGDAIYSGVIDGGISDMEYIEGSVFVTRSDTVTKIDIKSGKLTEIQTYEKGTDIIVYDENNILLCCQTKAKYIKF